MSGAKSVAVNGEFAVMYALNGYSTGAEQRTHEIDVQQTIEARFEGNDRGARFGDCVWRVRLLLHCSAACGLSSYGFHSRQPHNDSRTFPGTS